MQQMFADYRPDDHGNPLDIDVRPLEARDIDQCAALAVERNGGDRTTWHTDFEQHLERGDRQTFVAVHGGHVAGYGTTSWMGLSEHDGARNAPDGWYLTGVVVASHCRRRGIGRRLTEARLQWLATRTDRAWYVATAMNKPSLDLHAALGFRELTRDFQVPGVTFTGGVGVLSVTDLTGNAPRSIFGAVTDDPYGDPDLVALYDIDNPDGPDHDYYRALATALNARRVIDLGCGTGLLTRTLATPGRTVTGIDPSRTMLEWAQRQPGSERVTWILGDAATIPPTGDIDLLVCTGNTIMHLDADDLRDALHRVTAALRRGGVLSFETRNPPAREWQSWNREATYGERDTSVGRLTEWLEVTSVDGERVTFDAHNILPTGKDRVYTSVLYFRDAETIRAALHDAGFTDVAVDGGWNGEPVTGDSRLLVVRATK